MKSSFHQNSDSNMFIPAVSVSAALEFLKDLPVHWNGNSSSTLGFCWVIRFLYYTYVDSLCYGCFFSCVFNPIDPGLGYLAPTSRPPPSLGVLLIKDSSSERPTSPPWPSQILLFFQPIFSSGPHPSFLQGSSGPPQVLLFLHAS